MKPVRMYLDEVIARGIAKNDAEIARRIGVHKSSVSNWRDGSKAPADEQAIALAQMLGKPEGEVLAECAAARAKSAAARMAWERVAKLASTTAATSALAVVILQLTESAPLSALAGACAAGLCIMLSRLPRQMIMS